MVIRFGAAALFLSLVAVPACGRSNKTPQPTSSSTAASPIPPGSSRAPPIASAAPAPLAAPVESAAPVASTELAAARSDLVHCKAIGKRNPVTIGILRETIVDMETEGDSIFVFGFHRGLARLSLIQYRRDGTPPTVIARHTALGEPKGPVLMPEAAYYTRNKTLYRMPRGGGDVVELAKGFSYEIAVHGGYVYGVSCDAKRPTDQLNRVSTNGGPVEVLADIDHVKPEQQTAGTFYCDYHSLAADDAAVYVTHWNELRVLRISLVDRSVTTLATRAIFPSSLYLQGDEIFFQGGSGVYRCSKTKADAQRVTELGGSPWSSVLYTAKGLVIYEPAPAGGYARDAWIYEVPWATGKAQKVQYFKLLKPDEFPPSLGVLGFSADDECIYYARDLEKYIVLYARSRP